MTTSPEHPIDESPAGYSSAGCSPAEPASASPARSTMQPIAAKRYHLSANGSVSLFSLSQPWGALHEWVARTIAFGKGFLRGLPGFRSRRSLPVSASILATKSLLASGLPESVAARSGCIQFVSAAQSAFRTPSQSPSGQTSCHRSVSRSPYGSRPVAWALALDHQ